MKKRSFIIGTLLCGMALSSIAPVAVNAANTDLAKSTIEVKDGIDIDIDFPEIPEIPDIPEVPEIPEIPEVPEVPEVPNVEEPEAKYPDFSGLTPPTIVPNVPDVEEPAEPDASYPDFSGLTPPVVVPADTIEDVEETVMTSDATKDTQLYDINGKEIDYKLGANTDWKISKKVMINGEFYYRVSTDAWVKASDTVKYEITDQVVVVEKGKTAKLIDSKGNVIEGRELASNTGWLADKTASINGKLHYRVSTNEWVSIDDLHS